MKKKELKADLELLRENLRLAYLKIHELKAELNAAQSEVIATKREVRLLQEQEAPWPCAIDLEKVAAAL